MWLRQNLYHSFPAFLVKGSVAPVSSLHEDLKIAQAIIISSHFSVALTVAFGSKTEPSGRTGILLDGKQLAKA